MAQKPQHPRKKRRAIETASESQTVAPSLPPDFEHRLRAEFEALIRRMQSPASAAAYDTLANLSVEDVREFFQSPRGQRTTNAASSDFARHESATFLPLSRAEELDYPCVILVSLNYFATGEGHMRGLLIASVSSAKDLRDEVARTWSDYHAQGVEIRPWTDLSDDGALLPVQPARDVLTRSAHRPWRLRYASTLHVNYA